MFVGRLLVCGRRCRRILFLFLSVVVRVIDCAGCALGRPILCAACLAYMLSDSLVGAPIGVHPGV